MSQAEQFFQAVLDHPEDNALRLIYADWLEEAGDPRGELIRVQVQLAQTSHADLHWRTLKNRETQLLDDYLAEWMGPSARRVWKGFAEAHYQPFFADRGSCRLHRGFRETARMRAKTFLEHADQIFASLPLRELHVFLESYANHLGRDLLDLSACGKLAKIRHLILEFPPFFFQTEPQSQTGIESLLDAAPLSELETLSFRYSMETRFLTDPLSQSTSLGNLRTLELSMFPGMANAEAGRRPPNRRDGIRALARAKHLPKLRELALTYHWLTDSMFQPLRKANWFEQLTLLDLTGSALSDESFRQIAASPVCGQLQTLRLSRWIHQGGSPHLQSSGIAALAQADFSQLRELELRYQNIGSGKLRSLLRSQTLGNLAVLDLSGNPLKDSGAKVLAQSETLANLRVLKLEACHLTDEGLAAMAHSPHLKHLEQLFVGRNTFQESGLKALLNSPLAAKLRTLSFAGCGTLGQRGFTLLAKSATLQGLAELDLTGQQLTAHRVQKLVDSPYLQELAHLNWFQPFEAKRDHEAQNRLHEHWPGRVRL